MELRRVPHGLERIELIVGQGLADIKEGFAAVLHPRQQCDLCPHLILKKTIG